MERGDDLLVIGRFARLTGLSVGALRHYDELDLLRPDRVDPETGYRSYRRDQLDVARTIARLRDLEVPLETIRAYLSADDPARYLTVRDARTLWTARAQDGGTTRQEVRNDHDTRRGEGRGARSGSRAHGQDPGSAR